ncbi:EAL domain-containing protein [Vibrio sp. T187]|uniref:EAL domain-containing response regulator n=1 Tax=Vibrio TaxID=662 RepID=UPI0010C9F813|nr:MULTISPECIES: EAL domain-containing response regulator [Vibrio]MBW3695079.1 EAL domain-containing protein [Vibrio sp. T187]
MKQKQIVVIDDSPAILMVMQSMLQELGYTNIVTSSNPSQALSHIKQHPEKYSAVFTDLNMPEIDGMEVIKQLGEMNYPGGVCIISDMDHRVIGLAANIARQHRVHLIGNLAKPIDLKGLEKSLSKLHQLNLRRSPDDATLTYDELLCCINNHYITPYYQPKVDLQTQEIKGVEVLARICRPGETNAILPGRFIDMAHQHLVLDEITNQIIHQVMEDMPTLTTIFGKDIHVGLNLSPSQLMDSKHSEYLHQLVTERNIPHHQLVIEITEEYAVKTTEQLESLNRFRLRGFGLSLDDFGVGFTNLQQLKHLPFTELKIDRSLILGIQNDTFNQVVVDSLVKIADNLDFLLIAEGMESIEELNYLEQHYQHMLVQGFLICPPKPLESLVHWYKSWVKIRA